MRPSKPILILMFLLIVGLGYYGKRSLDLKEKALDLQAASMGVGQHAEENAAENALLMTIDAVSGKPFDKAMNADQINMRADHNINSKVIEVMYLNEPVITLEEFTPDVSDNQAITKKEIDFTTALASFRLSPNKAVHIVEQDDAMVRVRYEHPELGALEARVTKDTVEAIGNNPWVKVRAQSKNEGWILKRFLKDYSVQ